MNVSNDALETGQMSSTLELLEVYDITEEDLKHIQHFGEFLLPAMDSMVNDWYEWLQQREEFEQFFSDKEVLHRVQKLQLDYWNAFFKAEIDENYVHRRRVVGEAHARIGLPMHTYFSGMNIFLKLFWNFLENTKLSREQMLSTGHAVAKLLHLDTAVVVETYTNIVNEQITSQSRALMEMSTPVTQIWNGILLLPLVGIIDSKRAQDIMNATLAKIAQSQARVFILDISGVGVVDTAVANHLIKITKATRLMGCESFISGVSPAISQTIVELGIDVGSVKTTATMQDALADAFRRTGMAIVEARR
jgi:rsbT co-antagonist protein RsbR